MSFFALSSEEILAIQLSFVVALLSVAVSLVPGVVLGYLLARKNFFGKALLETLISVSLVLPPVVVGYIMLVVLGRKGVLGSWVYQTLGITIPFTTTAAVLAASVVGFPLMVRAFRLAFQGVDSKLEQASLSLGAGRWKTFLSVTVPLARNGLLAGCVLAFARSLGEFGATVVFAGNIEGETRTLALAIFSMAERPGGLDDAWRLVVICILIAGAAMFASQKLERKLI